LFPPSMLLIVVWRQLVDFYHRFLLKIRHIGFLRLLI